MKITFTNEKKDDKNVLGMIFASNKEFDEIYRDNNGKNTLEIGIGDPQKMNMRKLPILIRRAIILAKKRGFKKLSLNFQDYKSLFPEADDVELSEIIAVNAEMANYEFIRYRSKPKNGWPFVEEIIISGDVSVDIKKASLRGQMIGIEVNSARDLANTPGADMTPSLLAKAAREAVKGTSAKITVLGKKEMEKLKMNAVLSVAKGSDEDPQFIIIEYKGGDAKSRPTVLVGKGITFDTGGINLKPSDSVLGMNLDMSGGAAVIHTLALAAKLKIKKNIIGLVPAAENMPSGSSYRPGDVITSMSGKTIEVRNTDAEGRIILADALTYAQKYNPSSVIDVATLTGASIIALGQRTSALLTPSDNFADVLMKISEQSGDLLWRLPLWEEYETDIKGSIGDITNIHNKGSRYGGAINGGVFLYQFTKDYPKDCNWAHIDIAPRMESIPEDSLTEGAVGAPVRLLLKAVETI